MILLKEFGCGMSLRTGAQFLMWFYLATNVIGFEYINYHVYTTKKMKLSDNIIMFFMLNFVTGTIQCFAGLYGIHENKKRLIQQAHLYSFTQVGFALVTLWSYFVFIYPTQPPNPKKTAFVIVTSIWGFLLYAAIHLYSSLIIYSYYKYLQENASDDDRYLVPNMENAPLYEDNLRSNMSDITSITTADRTYWSAMPQGIRPQIAPVPSIISEHDEGSSTILKTRGHSSFPANS